MPRVELGHKISSIQVCIIHQIGHIYLVSVSSPKAFAITPGEVEMLKFFFFHMSRHFPAIGIQISPFMDVL